MFQIMEWAVVITIGNSTANWVKGSKCRKCKSDVDVPERFKESSGTIIRFIRLLALIVVT